MLLKEREGDKVQLWDVYFFLFQWLQGNFCLSLLSHPVPVRSGARCCSSFWLTCIYLLATTYSSAFFFSFFHIQPKYDSLVFSFSLSKKKGDGHATRAPAAAAQLSPIYDRRRVVSCSFFFFFSFFPFVLFVDMLPGHANVKRALKEEEEEGSGDDSGAKILKK